MKFLDQAKVYIQSGKGGAGCVSFRREANVPRGGPDGGDGGRGGSVIALCADGLNTLIDYRYRQHFKAQAGRPGAGRMRTGAKGDDVTLKLPLGTQILNEDGTIVMADLTELGQSITLAQGGDGGRGNAAFKSATNQAPRRAEKGFDGMGMWVWLNLKLIADAGLVGLPNAGKSSLLARVSRAKPKIADYPFTTLHPNLGVVGIDDNEFVMADIPGLIEGAHAGAGLGTRFLGAIERCSTLLHLCDGTSTDPITDWHSIRGELKAYDDALLKRTIITVITKSDAMNDSDIETLTQSLLDAGAGEVFAISAVSGAGITPFLRHIWQSVAQAKSDATNTIEGVWHP